MTLDLPGGTDDVQASGLMTIVAVLNYDLCMEA